MAGERPSGAPPEREFTVEQADAMLPELRWLLGEIRDARRVVLAESGPVRRAAASNGGGAAAIRVHEALGAIRRGVEAVAGHGVLLRDADMGLVDFPSRRDGRPAFLCWHMGEERVAHWHGPESSFLSRRPLDEGP